MFDFLIFFPITIFVQAEEAGLPPPPEGADMTSITLSTEQGHLSSIHNEETAGQSRADMDANHNMSDQMRKNMSNNLTNQIVSKSVRIMCIFF